MTRWSILPIPDDHGASLIFRLNALGSLYFFEKFVLQKHRLVEHLHRPICETLERQNVYFLLEVPRDHFKALDTETLLPTPEGFRSIASIHPGDYVFGLDGLPTLVVGESTVEERPLYEVEFSTGDTIRCDAEHLWLTDARKSRENSKPSKPCPTVKTTSEIASTIKCRKEYNHRIHVGQAVSCQEKSLAVPPYTLGAWLGDGTSSAGQITCNDPEIICQIVEEGISAVKQKAKFMYGLPGLASKLRSIGVLNNKHVPEDYFFASKGQRLELLRGLMDTDGSISKQGQCSFSNTDKHLVEQVRIILCSLGYKPSPIGTYRARLNGEYVGWFHVVTFYAYPESSPFHLPRKSDRLYERKANSMQGYRQIIAVRTVGVGQVKCIKVDAPDGLYLAGTGFIPTHNTTCVTEGLPIWRALPFDERDEASMRELGYGDEWIAWMKWAHNPGIRILTVSETMPNAARMGRRIDKHFENNNRFRDLFPEILPTEKSIWNSESKLVTSDVFHANGEGTFDYLGVGGALQSRHYDFVIEDDIVGKDAMKSDLVMEDTIDYHKLMEGAFDGPEHGQIVVGNRWSPHDLNGWIRDNDPDFIIESHSALGGCCDIHPSGLPIFPEEFSIARLERIRRVEGPIFFSHQYLNQPLEKDEIVFSKEWLRWYAPRQAPGQSDPSGSRKMYLTHEVRDGEAVSDVAANTLERIMIVDPNHAGAHGRARHAIVVIGYHQGRGRVATKFSDHESIDPDRIYLLDVWAASMNYEDLLANIWKMADKWQMKEFWLETVAAQKYLKAYLDYRNKIEKRYLRVRELKTERTKNAKWDRIDALAPAFEQGRFYVRRDQSAFLDEYYRYSHSTRYPVDVLDCCGYSLSVLEPMFNRGIVERQRERKEKMMGVKRNVAGY